MGLHHNFKDKDDNYQRYYMLGTIAKHEERDSKFKKDYFEEQEARRNSKVRYDPIAAQRRRTRYVKRSHVFEIPSDPIIFIRNFQRLMESDMGLRVRRVLNYKLKLARKRI